MNHENAARTNVFVRWCQDCKSAAMRLSFVRAPAFLALLATAGAATFVAAACGGDDGPQGNAGLNGVPGPQGPAGPVGPAVGADGGSILSGACTQPCHTFGGVVDQWRFSNHSHPQANEIGGGTCGNCHAIDSLQQRVANKYSGTGDAGAPTNVAKGHIGFLTSTGTVGEIGYGGATAIGRIHCTTCHDFNPTNDPHVTGKYIGGSAKIRVPGGPTDLAFIEKSPTGSTATGQSLAYKAGNVCVFCHKSRKDVSAYVLEGVATNRITSFRWGPHNGPQADVYSGKGGYHFTGSTYGSSTHAGLPNACVSCHMGPVAANSNVPDHTMKPNVAYCKTCHTQYTGTDFDVQGGRTLIKKALKELATALNNAGLLTRSEAAPYGPLEDDDLEDGQFQLNNARPVATNVDGPQAGALYNYLIIARGKDLGVHNPTYAKQLLWDSIRQVTGADPTSLPSRPQ